MNKISLKKVLIVIQKRIVGFKFWEGEVKFEKNRKVYFRKENSESAWEIE